MNVSVINQYNSHEHIVFFCSIFRRVFERTFLSIRIAHTPQLCRHQLIMGDIKKSHFEQICDPRLRVRFKCSITHFILSLRLSINTHAESFVVGIFVLFQSRCNFPKTYVISILSSGGGSAVRYLPKNVGEEEFRGDPTVGPRPKVWTRDQKW